MASTKKASIKTFAEGRLYVAATFNNTLVTLTDDKGKTVTWSSCGRAGFKGSRRSTPFAATTAIENILEQAKEAGVKKLSVFISGPGSGRDAALRILRAHKNFDIVQISDVTPIPHNGPKPPKQRKG